MKTISLAEYESRRRGAQVLSQDRFGEKVLRTPDGMIIKLFRRKRLLSSAWLSPYARRFARAAQRLATLDVPSVQVSAVYKVPAIRRYAVVYRALAGVPLRQAILDPIHRHDLLERLARFLAMLHAKGVYFRALHFGNVLVNADRSLALIDVSESYFYRGPLRTGLRARNFKPLVSYSEDSAALQDFGAARFLETYLAHAQLTDFQKRRFLDALTRIDRLFVQAGHSPTGVGQRSTT